MPLKKSLSILLGGGLGLALVVGHKSSSPLGADNFTFSGEAFVGVALKFDVLGLKNTIWECVWRVSQSDDQNQISL